MHHVRELESFPRPHITLVSTLRTNKKSQTGYGMKNRAATSDPVLKALSTEAPPGGMLSTLKSANSTGMSFKRGGVGWGGMT